MLKPEGMAELAIGADSTPATTLRTMNLLPTPGSNWTR